MVCLTSGISSSGVGAAGRAGPWPCPAAVAAGGARGDARLDVGHAGKRLHGLASPAVDLGAGERRLLAGELQGEGDLAGLDRQPVDEPEGHDVLADVRIQHAAERRQDGLLGEPGRLAPAEKTHRASLYGRGQRGSSNAAPDRALIPRLSRPESPEVEVARAAGIERLQGRQLGGCRRAGETRALRAARPRSPFGGSPPRAWRPAEGASSRNPAGVPRNTASGVTTRSRFPVAVTKSTDGTREATSWRVRKTITRRTTWNSTAAPPPPGRRTRGRAKSPMTVELTLPRPSTCTQPSSIRSIRPRSASW